MTLRWLRVVATCVLLLAGVGLRRAGAEDQARRVNVAAASDLKFALDELVEAFGRTAPGIAVTVTYGSSGTFFSQISNGAPFDMFLSADVDYPKRLAEAGLAAKDSVFPYAVGRIVLWVPATSRLPVERGLQVLASPDLRKIAIANPRHAPYGRAAEAALRTFGVYDAVKDRLVLGENIAQTAQFVQSGNADAGIIASPSPSRPPWPGKDGTSRCHSSPIRASSREASSSPARPRPKRRAGCVISSCPRTAGPR